jgi:hypothetical protein
MVFGGGIDGEREWLDPLMDVAHAATTAHGVADIRCGT